MQRGAIRFVGAGCLATSSGAHQVEEGRDTCRMCGSVPSWAETFAADIRRVVADESWQLLRHSFLGRWKLEGESLLVELRRYAGDQTDPARVRRVLNYLTGSGFRSGTINPPGRAALLGELRAARERGVAQERKNHDHQEG